VLHVAASQPKVVICVYETNKSCCGWQCTYVNF